jgi:hypothetical protein
MHMGLEIVDFRGHIEYTLHLCRITLSELTNRFRDVLNILFKPELLGCCVLVWSVPYANKTFQESKFNLI